MENKLFKVSLQRRSQRCCLKNDTSWEYTKPNSCTLCVLSDCCSHDGSLSTGAPAFICCGLLAKPVPPTTPPSLPSPKVCPFDLPPRYLASTSTMAA
eukprot:1099587-Pelagomonas_calceolata.AAC.7